MAIWTLTIKSTKIMNGVRLERGMRVQVSSLYHPIGYNNGEATRDAFMRVYGIDMKRLGALSTVYLDVQRVG